jgi:hypothetical protein
MYQCFCVVEDIATHLPLCSTKEEVEISLLSKEDYAKVDLTIWILELTLLYVINYP